MPADILLGGMLFFLDLLSETCSLQPRADLAVGHRAAQVRASQSNYRFPYSLEDAKLISRSNVGNVMCL